jgi:nijmegen breakage syndrome protein 1
MLVKDETQSPSAKSKAKKNAVSKSDAEVMEAARIKAEKAAEQKDLITGDFADIPTAAIRNLTIIETMPVGRTTGGPERASRADESSRWDDKWNGRKNFKRFKRRGGEEGGARVRKVIVRLEEAKKRDYGIGEDYWLEERDDSQKRRKKKGRGTQEQDVDGQAPSQARSTSSTGGQKVSSIPQDESVPVDDEDEYEGMNADEELAAATAMFKAQQKASVEEITPPSADVEITSSRASERSTHPPASKPTSSSTSTTTTRGSRSQASSLHSQRTTQTLGDKTSKSQNVPSSSIGTTTTTTTGKRSVPSSAASSSKAPPAKRARGLFARSEDEDSDDDGLAFKFRKRK